MGASSDLLPLSHTEPIGAGDDTNPPRPLEERTVPNGPAPLLVSQFTPRTITFRPSEHPGELGRLDRYRVLRQLGKGGMGAVFLGFDERLRRKVALKVMLPDAAADPQSKERFLREARAAAQIAHDNVIAVYEADEADGLPYIAMQYLQGYPLDEYLAKKGRPSFPQIVRIGREIAMGLAAAHRLGLVHRDIKPGNVWLEAPQGRVKILDFGLARPAKTVEGELTQSGTVVGTPAYMAPEQARGHKVDGRADLFSLGVLLYRLVTNHLPFDGPDVMAMLTALAVEDPKPVLECEPATPKPLADLIHELLAKKPAQRPQTADEVSARLNSLAGAPGATTSNPVVYVPVPVTVIGTLNAFEDLNEAQPDAADATKTGRHPPPARRWPVGIVAAGLAAMLVGGGVLWSLLGGAKPEPKAVEAKDARKPFEPPKVPKKADAPAPIDHAPFAKLDAAWLKTVSALPATDILGPVNEELKRRNPDYDGKGLNWIKDPLTGTKTALELKSDHVADLMPLWAIPNLEGLAVLYAGKEQSRLTNLAPLRGLKKLRHLRLDGHIALRDLEPIANLPIESLSVANSSVESLEPLRGLPLEKLEIPLLLVPDFRPLAKLPLRSFTFGHPDLAPDLAPLAECPLEHVRIDWGHGLDLSPLRSRPLKSFTMINTAQPDLAPLEGSSIEDFSGFDPIQYEAFLRKLPKLQTVGSYTGGQAPAADYFAGCERHRKEWDGFVAAMRELPIDDRVKAVRRRYEEMNAGKKSVFAAAVENGEAVAVDFTGSDGHSSCWNLAFLRAFPTLRKVTWKGIAYAPLLHQVTDLPIEEIEIPNTSMHLSANLHAFARMKSLKSVNGVPIAEFAERWRLFPTK